MSRVRLTVHVDGPERVHLPGEPVRGRVQVDVDEDCSCRALAVAAAWRTSGEANQAEGEGPPVNLGAGEWRSGDRLSFPFSIAIPEGPPTYEGTHFSVAWTVRADAALSLAFDGKGEAVFQVGPAPAAGGTLVTKEDAGCVEAGCAAVAVLMLIGGGLPLLLARHFPGAGYVVAAVLGGILAAIMIPQALAYRGIGKAIVEVGPSPVRRGEELACQVSIQPRRRLQLRKVRVVLTATESSPKGSGKSRKILAAVLATASADLEGETLVEAGHRAVFAGVVPVPADGFPSFAAGDHKVAWTAKVTVEYPALPDPSWDLEVRVA